MTQSVDEDERTKSMGLFNTADAFRLSATALGSVDIRHGHAEKPRYFLYYHALELYLKALLRQKYNVAALRKFGHNTKRLLSEAEALGLRVTQEDHEIFAIVGDTDAVIEARYIYTGTKHQPALDALNCTCDRIRENVGDALRKRGLFIRP